MRTIAFFNNKEGVGKTALVYHLAWMYAELGLPVIALDLDPQATLTTMFLSEDEIEPLWANGQPRATIFGAIRPLLEGTGDVAPPTVLTISENIGLIAGDLALSAAEDELSRQWSDCLDGKLRVCGVPAAFRRVMKDAAQQQEAALVLIDVGPNLGAINRAALFAAEHVVIPLAPDLYSLQGLKTLGPTLRRWRAEWQDRTTRTPLADMSLPQDTMTAAGYILMQHAVRLDRPMLAHERWMRRIPRVYRESILGESAEDAPQFVTDDPHCIAALRYYGSLMAMAQEAHKPMFFLRPADGALGGHAAAVQECYQDFQQLAVRIAQRCKLVLPSRF